ncbi:MAG: hypothetical protein RIB59_12805 [Rhodospirillales bacterium]
MEKPKLPTLEEFKLTEQDIRSAPKLLNQKLTREIHSKIGLGTGVVLGLGSLWGIFAKTESLVYGLFFGTLIGFVVFLMISFLGSLFVFFIANVISYFQRALYGRSNEKARQVYRYQDAHRKFDQAMRQYEKDRQKRFKG